jgi:D-alanyl-D-alanine carboxypeptidase (penicillin-binding protein 5/6)
MLENLIFFFLSSEIANNLEDKNIQENSFLELEISSIEKKINQEDEKNNKEISGKSGLVLDLNSSAVLWKKNQEVKLPMASLTKLMSILLIMENHSLDEEVRLDANSVLHP